MTDWPDGSHEAVYVPPAIATAPAGSDELRARLASARVRDGLPVDDDTLSQIMQAGYGSDPARAEIYTASEQEDIYGDNDRVEAARAALADAEAVLAGLQVCWRKGRRGVRVLLTAEIDRYHRRLSEVIDPERLVIDEVAFTEAELARRGEEVWARTEQLAAEGIYITSIGTGVDGFVIAYLAADHARADQTMRDLFGDFATIRYKGASHHTFRAFPFGGWLAEEHRLHVFYGLPFNGERPAGCQALETETAVIVALSIKDWRGGKTLIGGFKPCYATVTLEKPVGERYVIDDAENRARPHWTEA